MNNISRGSPIATHLILNLYSIRDGDLLQYVWKGKEILKGIILSLNLDIIGETPYQFNPSGYTIGYIMSDGHFTIHSYPEYRAIYLDIFCSSHNFNPNQAIQVLKEAFKTETSTHIIIRR